MRRRGIIADDLPQLAIPTPYYSGFVGRLVITINQQHHSKPIVPHKIVS
jgi:hypothetical protein